MTRERCLLVPAISAVLAVASAAGTARATPSPATIEQDEVEGGTHWRIERRSRVVHVWQPPGFDARRAGIVVYVHGHSTTADAAWTEYHLARQFRESIQNALFLVPEAPQDGRDAPPFDTLDALLAFVRRNARIQLPRGTVVVAGHSGAYRTIAQWLISPRIETVVLLDAMYGLEEEYRVWVESSPAAGERKHRLTLISSTTAERTETFLALLRTNVVRREGLPESYDGLSREERRARVLYVHSTQGHMQVAADGRALPILLRTSPLRRLE